MITVAIYNFHLTRSATYKTVTTKKEITNLTRDIIQTQTSPKTLTAFRHFLNVFMQISLPTELKPHINNNEAK